jgi:hypothetical protein
MALVSRRSRSAYRNGAHPMNEDQATAVAEALGGKTWQSGGGIWLVLFHGKDGRMIVISEDAVCEYDDETSFEQGQATKTIFLEQNLSVASD